MSKMNALAQEKVPLKEKIFFGMADFYGGGASAMVGAVHLAFLVSVGVSPALAGLVIGLSKIWDAISDPVVGVLSDNTRSKWGRRKPYLAIGGFFITLSLIMMFAPLQGVSSEGFKVAFYILAYIIYDTVQTVITVPYSSLSAEISEDYKERTTINTIRLVFSMISGGLSALVPVTVFNLFLDGKMSLTTVGMILAIGFGVFYSIPVILAGIFSKERAPLPDIKSTLSVKTFVTPFKVKAFVYLLICYIAAFVCMDIVSSNMIFYIRYGLKSSLNPTYALLGILIPSALAVPVLYLLMKKGLSKPLLFRIGIPLYILGTGLLSFYSGGKEWPIIVFAIMMGLGVAGSQMLPWIIFPDVIDAAELKLGVRQTGSFSGVMSFMRKVGTAIAMGISGLVLQFTGFIKPESDPVTGKVLQQPVQPVSAEWGLRLLIFISIVVFMAIAYISATRLKLTPFRSGKIKEFLVLKKEGRMEEMSVEDKKVYEEIKKDLL